MGMMRVCLATAGDEFGVMSENSARLLTHAVWIAEDMETGLICCTLDTEPSRGGVRMGCEVPAGG